MGTDIQRLCLEKRSANYPEALPGKAIGKLEAEPTDRRSQALPGNEEFPTFILVRNRSIQHRSLDRPIQPQSATNGCIWLLVRCDTGNQS